MSCAMVSIGTQHARIIVFAAPAIGALAGFLGRQFAPLSSQGMAPLSGAAFQAVATSAAFVSSIPGRGILVPGIKRLGASPRTAYSIVKVIVGISSGIIAYYSLNSKLSITPESALANAVISALIAKLVQLALERYFPPKVQGEQLGRK